MSMAVPWKLTLSQGLYSTWLHPASSAVVHGFGQRCRLSRMVNDSESTPKFPKSPSVIYRAARTGWRLQTGAR